MFVKNLIHLLLLAIITVNSELFTSIEYLSKAIEESQGVSKLLDDYIHLEETRLAQLKLLSQKLKRQKRQENPDDVIGNPMKIFKFVKLYGLDLSNGLNEYIASSPHKDLQMIVERQKTYLPSREDMEGVIDGIARLQRTYKLSVEQMANGSIHGYQIGTLTAKDCYDIGDHMLEANYMSYSMEWFDVSLRKLKQDLYCEGPDEENHTQKEQCGKYGGFNLTPLMSEVVKKRTIAELKLEEQRRNFTHDLESLPEDIYVAEWKQFLMQDMEERKIEYFGTEIPFNDQNYKVADALCRGETIQSNSPNTNLYCGYYNKHPLLILQPAKMEVLYGDPLIFMYHDIITEKQMDSLKEDVFKQLKQATVFATKSNDVTATGSRVSRSHYLQDEHDTVRKLFKYTEAITGLTMVGETTELLQVANYGIGGHYMQHHDYFLDGHVDHIDKKQRLATLLFYLSDVQAGGATVFPSLGVRIPPIKGAAAFWLNLDVDLKGRMDTVHAGCPVLLGSKWIANKWISVGAQQLGCYNL